MVVNKSGQQRFACTYDENTPFYPCGICTDVLGQILVCDSFSKSLIVLDQDGKAMNLLLTSEQGIDSPISVCMDKKNYLYLGQNSNRLTVYKYEWSSS